MSVVALSLKKQEVAPHTADEEYGAKEQDEATALEEENGISYPRKIKHEVEKRVVAYLSCNIFLQAEDGTRAVAVTGVQTCALPISAQHQHRFRQRQLCRLLPRQHRRRH